VSTPIDERLQLLDAHYTWQISAAVEAGRMDLVRDLANDYHDEALAVMLAAEGSTSSQMNWGTAEILELGGWPRSENADRRAGWRFRFWRRSSR
jgi:erythromycin esterase-like protein